MPERTIETQYGPSRSAIRRHRPHITETLILAKAIGDEAHGDELGEQLSEIRRFAWQARAAAERDRDWRACLAALKVLLDHADLALRVAEKRIPSLTDSPEWLALSERLLTWIRTHPELEAEFRAVLGGGA
jgi:hypothetical protein